MRLLFSHKAEQKAFDIGTAALQQLNDLLFK